MKMFFDLTLDILGYVAVFVALCSVVRLSRMTFLHEDKGLHINAFAKQVLICIAFATGGALLWLYGLRESDYFLLGRKTIFSFEGLLCIGSLALGSCFFIAMMEETWHLFADSFWRPLRVT